MESIAPPAMPEHNLLTRFLAGLHSRSDIPLRLALWNGSHYDLGPDPQVTVRLTGPASLRYFPPPVWTILPKVMSMAISMWRAGRRILWMSRQSLPIWAYPCAAGLVVSSVRCAMTGQRCSRD